MKDIETGVDKLVSLVEESKKISLDDAAKALGVSTVVIQEWADFLEEQGVISVEYSLSKVWLKVKTLTKVEVETKVKEYDTKKEAFIRKVESSLKSIEKETEGFDRIRDEFAKIKTGIGADMDKVEEEINELKKYENLKQKIDEDILKQKQEYQRLISGSHDEVDKEKERLKELLKTIDVEKGKLELEKKEFQTLDENEENLKSRLQALNGILETLRRKVDQQDEIVKNSETRIHELQSIAEKMAEEAKIRREGKIEPLMKLSQEQQQKINFIQDQIVKKVEDTKKRLEKNELAAREVAQRFKSFFERKAEIDNLIKQIDEDRNSLKSELDGLMKKAIAFNLVSKNSDIKGYVADLEKTFNQLDKKKYVFKKELEKLSTLVKN